MGKQRIEYVDSAKAILILLVILGHILITLNPEYNKPVLVSAQVFIYTFHVPAFFIIHGVLFDNEKWKNKSIFCFLRRKVKTLIIPYVFFEVIGIAWKKAICGQLVSDGIYNLITIGCNVGANWFLIAMFFGSILFAAYVKHPNKTFGVISVILSIIAAMFRPDNQLAIVIARGLVAYSFIMIGNMLKCIFLTEKTKNRSACCCRFP